MQIPRCGFSIWLSAVAAPVMTALETIGKMLDSIFVEASFCITTNRISFSAVGYGKSVRARDPFDRAVNIATFVRLLKIVEIG